MAGAHICWSSCTCSAIRFSARWLSTVLHEESEKNQPGVSMVVGARGISGRTPFISMRVGFKRRAELGHSSARSETRRLGSYEYRGWNARNYCARQFLHDTLTMTHERLRYFTFFSHFPLCANVCGP